MATSSTGNQTYICHFCSDEFSNRATLLAHFPYCQIKKSSKQLNENLLQPPQLNRTQRDILLMVKLHPSTSQFSSNHFNHHLSSNDLNLQIPLSNLYSHGYFSPSKQSSFDDSYCAYTNTQSYIPTNDIEQQQQQEENSNLLNENLLTYHIYKYSRRERDLFYAGVKRIISNKRSYTTTKKIRSKEIFTSLFNQSNNFLINIPTKINAHIRINSHSNPICPLLFCPHFHTLVTLPTNKSFENYLFHIRIYFQLIHSIASQEFQIIVHNYDNQQEFSYTSLSFLNILRETMLNYTTNLQTTFKRNYFQSFQQDNHHDEHESTSNHDNEYSIPPLKIRRYDDSSYEIEKRSVSSSSSSSSSGMSITQIHNGQQYEDRRRRFDTRRHKKFPSRISDNQINSNFNDIDKKDISNLTIGSPLQSDLSIIDHQQSKDRTSNESFLSLSHIGEQKPKKSTSPILIKEHSNDFIPKYQSVVLNEGARIRIVNCSNDNNKHSFSRNPSLSSTTKKYSNSIDKVDENWSTKTTRINTRKISSTNSKTSDISEVLPSYQAQSVVLSHNEIANKWLTHSVFYRCHACSNEEFFVVLSRECMRLHISSKHGNMEENFKQRISNFLNNQGRALKIFQHYLKWQQPWLEKEIDQIFQLSNINNRTNGAV